MTCFCIRNWVYGLPVVVFVPFQLPIGPLSSSIPCISVYLEQLVNQCDEIPLPVDLLFAPQGKSLEPHSMGDVPEYRLYSTESLAIDVTTLFAVDLALHLLDEAIPLVCFSDTLLDGHMACPAGHRQVTCLGSYRKSSTVNRSLGLRSVCGLCRR